MKRSKRLVLITVFTVALIRVLAGCGDSVRSTELTNIPEEPDAPAMQEEVEIPTITEEKPLDVIEETPLENTAEDADATEPEPELTESMEATPPEEVSVAVSEQMPEEESSANQPSETGVETEVPQTEEQAEALNDLQRNSIAMLNHLTVLTQEISSSKGSRLFLEQVYASLINDTYPNAVDVWTQAELDDLLDTLETFRMVSVKRERLQYIYENNKAQALRSAIPNPIGILSAINSRNVLKTAASLIFIAVDSVTSYNSYKEQLDMQYLTDGWDLDDVEASELSRMRRNSFSYMINMVRDYNLPGDLALNEKAVTDFVEWKNMSNVVRRISILEANEKVYAAMESYWLELAKSYYENGDYEKCLTAIDRFDSITCRIFRKNYEYAETLPYAILSAQEVYSGAEYEERAKTYCEAILENTDATDWASHYFVALIYIDLFASTENTQYIDTAYRILLENVSYLVDEQKELNTAWLSPVQEVTAGKNATKQEEADIKNYNKMIKAERKTALPPISEPLYLNCDLLFNLADEIGVSSEEKKTIEQILHENDENLFLVALVDNRFRFTSDNDYPDGSSMEIEFNGKELTIPAYAASDSGKIDVTIVDNTQDVTIQDWILDEVVRPKDGDELSFTAKYSSEGIKSIKLSDGTSLQINIYPREDKSDLIYSFRYIAKQTGWLVERNPLKTIVYERVF